MSNFFIHEIVAMTRLGGAPMSFGRGERYMVISSIGKDLSHD